MDASKPCCNDMKKAIDEGDVILGFYARTGRFSLRLSDGRRYKDGVLYDAYSRDKDIAFCPWCGKNVGDKPEKGTIQ